MAKYSSDSDLERSSSKYRRNKYSRRSSSSDSSDSSSSHQKHKKYYKSRKVYRSRSRSRDKERSKNYKNVKDSSKDKKRYRSQKSRSSSNERNQLKKRSRSREKSTSRSSSSQSNAKISCSDKPTSTSKDNFCISDTKIKASVLDDINNDEFVPKQFVSSAKNKEPKMKNIVIDIDTDVIHVPQIKNTIDEPNTIFHTSIIADKEQKFEKWVKKLYSLRQKALSELNYS